MEAWLFSSALTSLLDKQYLTRRRFLTHIGYWTIYTVTSVVAALIISSETWRSIALALFFIYGVWLAFRLLKTYRQAVRAMDDYYSDDVAVYIRWMSHFTYWAAVFGVAVGVLTFLPEKYIFLWILSAVPFYIYLYVSYMNYLIFYERVQAIFKEEPMSEPQDSYAGMEPIEQGEIPVCYMDLAGKLKQWQSERKYTQSGITAADLALTMGTNRTYLIGYIKLKYGLSFRNWICTLRIDYAKELLVENSELSVAEIAGRVGYQSSTHFIKLFSESERISPTKWRKERTK